VNAEPHRRYATIAAFDAALRAKLMAQVSAQRTYQDLRKELAFDRVLARLVLAAPDSWLLKGAVALEYRLDLARATSDIDISARVGLEEMAQALEDAAALQLGDYFAIRIGERTKPVADIETFRFHIDVLYENGRLFEHLKIDVGFADPWIGEPQELSAPALLEFAGIPPAKVRAIPVHQHLAEKIHAYTRRYGSRASTRVKDLVDMALIIEGVPIEEESLALVLRQIFSTRSTHIVPVALPPPPVAWQQVYAQLAVFRFRKRLARHIDSWRLTSMPRSREHATSSSERRFGRCLRSRWAGRAARLTKISTCSIRQS